MFYTHDNWRKPFKVVITDINESKKESNNESKNIINGNNIVKVYKNLQMNENDKNTYDDIAFLEINTKKIFIGDSPRNKITTLSRCYGPNFSGNSLLIEDDEPNNYIYIGSSIFRFTTLKRIRYYYSPVGFEDHPFPFAIDTSGNYYLLNENVVLKSNELMHKHIPNYVNPYDYYYHMSLITPDASGPIVQLPINDNFNRIKRWYIDGYLHTMKYVPDPYSEYDKLTFAGETMSYTDNRGVNHIITKKEYIDIIYLFGYSVKFERLDIVEVLHRRL